MKKIVPILVKLHKVSVDGITHMDIFLVGTDTIYFYIILIKTFVKGFMFPANTRPDDMQVCGSQEVKLFCKDYVEKAEVMFILATVASMLVILSLVGSSCKYSLLFILVFHYIIAVNFSKNKFCSRTCYMKKLDILIFIKKNQCVFNYKIHLKVCYC